MERIVDDMEKARPDKRNIGPDVKHVVDLLFQMAEKCGKLATEIRDEGRPMKNDEKQLVRFAVCPVLDDIASELKSAFLGGNAEWVDKSIDAIRQQTMPFMD